MEDKKKKYRKGLAILLNYDKIPPFVVMNFIRFNTYKHKKKCKILINDYIKLGFLKEKNNFIIINQEKIRKFLKK